MSATARHSRGVRSMVQATIERIRTTRPTLNQVEREHLEQLEALQRVHDPGAQRAGRRARGAGPSRSRSPWASGRRTRAAAAASCRPPRTATARGSGARRSRRTSAAPRRRCRARAAGPGRGAPPAGARRWSRSLRPPRRARRLWSPPGAVDATAASGRPVTVARAAASSACPKSSSRSASSSRPTRPGAGPP